MSSEFSHSLVNIAYRYKLLGIVLSWTVFWQLNPLLLQFIEGELFVIPLVARQRLTCLDIQPSEPGTHQTSTCSTGMPKKSAQAYLLLHTVIITLFSFALILLGLMNVIGLEYTYTITQHELHVMTELSDIWCFWYKVNSPHISLVIASTLTILWHCQWYKKSSQAAPIPSLSLRASYT